MIVDPDQARANFERWFGESKVVDANGRPLVVYHGSNSEDFDSFNISRGDDHPVNGISVTRSRSVAEFYGDNVIELYVRAENILDLASDWDDLLTDDQFAQWNAANTREECTKFLANLGYDAVYLAENDEIRVFSPTQLKSVSNCGLWDPESASLTDHEADNAPKPCSIQKG